MLLKNLKSIGWSLFELERGKHWPWLGSRGGKSTLGRLLTMIEQPSEGELYYQDQNLLVKDKSAEKLRQKSKLCFKTLMAL